MSEVVQFTLALGIVFFWGVAIGSGAKDGIKWLMRRPETLNEKLGKLVRSRIEQVHQQAQWLETGSGYSVKTAMDFDHNGRRIEIIVRETA